MNEAENKRAAACEGALQLFWFSGHRIPANDRRRLEFREIFVGLKVLSALRQMTHRKNLNFIRRAPEAV